MGLFLIFFHSYYRPEYISWFLWIIYFFYFLFKILLPVKNPRAVQMVGLTAALSPWDVCILIIPSLSLGLRRLNLVNKGRREPGWLRFLHLRWDDPIISVYQTMFSLIIHIYQQMDFIKMDLQFLEAQVECQDDEIFVI